MLSRKKFLELTSRYSLATFLLQHTAVKVFAYSPGRSTAPLNLSQAGTGPQQGFNLPDSIADYLLVENHEDGNLLLFAYDLRIDASLTLPGDRTVSIFAYRTTIDRTVNLPGKNFFLFTRHLDTSNTPTIDTSGATGHDFVQDSKPGLTGCNLVRKSPKAPNADNRSFDGILLDDPAAGGPMNGATGGNVWINASELKGQLNVKSDGGTGGHGEDGKAGLYGCFMGGQKHPDGNSAGYPGMSGADGAPGGYGGSAGEITLVYDNTSSSGAIHSSYTGGRQGDSGKGGKAGGGGMRTAVYVHGEPVELDPVRFPPSGLPGTEGETPDNDGIRNGKDGKLTAGSISPAYYKYIPLEFGKLLLLKADSLFLNGYDLANMVEAEALYAFIVELAQNNAGHGFNDNASDGEIKNYLASYLVNYHTDDDAWKALYLKAASHLNHMSLGLDFFGNPLNYAPNLDPTYLLTQYNKFIGFADGFETYVMTLLAEQKNIEITQENNQACIQQYNNTLDQLKKDIADLSALVISLNAEINKRFLTLRVLEANLVKDDEDFKEAVAAKTGGCQLIDVIHCVVAVVEIIAAIYTAGATAALAVKGMADVVQGLQNADTLELLKVALSDEGIIKQGVNELSKVDTDLKGEEQKIKDAYQVLRPNPNPVPPSLIGVNQDKFDQVIDSYLDLPEAQKYKVDYHNFIDFAEQTNQKRRELTASILAINTAWQNITIITKQKNILLNTNVALLQGKVPASVKTMITDLYYKSKEQLIRMIYLQRSAIKYQDPAGNYLDKNYDDYNVATLKTQLFTQNFTLIDSLNQRNFHRRSNLVPYSVSLYTDNAVNRTTAFKAFVVPSTDDTGTKIYTLEFRIRTWVLDANASQETKAKINYLNSVFLDAKNMKVMGLKAGLRSTEDINKNVIFTIRHLGNSSVTTAANFQQPKQFSHLWKETIPLTCKVAKKVKIGSFSEDDKVNLVGSAFGNGEKCYLGVSPFASWSLQIKENENPDLSVADIEHIIGSLASVDLYFWYYYENS
jgi:hypothetical protein